MVKREQASLSACHDDIAAQDIRQEDYVAAGSYSVLIAFEGAVQLKKQTTTHRQIISIRTSDFKKYSKCIFDLRRRACWSYIRTLAQERHFTSSCLLLRAQSHLSSRSPGFDPFELQFRHARLYR